MVGLAVHNAEGADRGRARGAHGLLSVCRQSAEVAGEHSRRRHVGVQFRRRSGVAGALVIPEDEELVLENRPARIRAKLILVQRIDVIGKIVLRVEYLITVEVESSAMKGIGAGFRLDADYSSRSEPISRVEIVRDHAELPGSVRIGKRSGQSEIRIHIRYAIQQEYVFP